MVGHIHDHVHTSFSLLSLPSLLPSLSLPNSLSPFAHLPHHIPPTPAPSSNTEVGMMYRKPSPCCVQGSLYTLRSKGGAGTCEDQKLCGHREQISCAADTQETDSEPQSGRRTHAAVLFLSTQCIQKLIIER